MENNKKVSNFVAEKSQKMSVSQEVCKHIFGNDHDYLEVINNNLEQTDKLANKIIDKFLLDEKACESDKDFALIERIVEMTFRQSKTREEIARETNIDNDLVCYYLAYVLRKLRAPSRHKEFFNFIKENMKKERRIENYLLLDDNQLKWLDVQNIDFILFGENEEHACFYSARKDYVRAEHADVKIPKHLIDEIVENWCKADDTEEVYLGMGRVVKMKKKHYATFCEIQKNENRSITAFGKTLLAIAPSKN